VEELGKAKEGKLSSPKVIICNTVKGKGVSFMENTPEWHANVFTEEKYKQAISELKR
jgi:transketolase